MQHIFASQHTVENQNIQTEKHTTQLTYFKLKTRTDNPWSYKSGELQVDCE